METKIYKYYFEIKALVILLSLLNDANAIKMNHQKFPMLMPNDVRPMKNSTYLCRAFEMPKDDYQYIVELTPSVPDPPPHHILLIGCNLPGQWKAGTPDHVWDCGARTEFESGFPAGPSCYGHRIFIYDWARKGLPFKLPPGVGIKVGKDTNIQYLVLQVHYSNVNKILEGDADHSGIVLTIMPSTTKKITKSAGIYLLLGDGRILPGEEEHMEMACKIQEHVVMHPISFQPHTHELGTMVSGYKIDKSGKWHLIGKHNPLDPQNFYPVVDKNLTIEYGDIVAGRCSYYNYRNHTVVMGETANDEMCNFYMMYYVEGDKLLTSKICYSGASPEYYWKTDPKITYIPPDIDKSA